jgi:hypothetical protein
MPSQILAPDCRTNFSNHTDGPSNDWLFLRFQWRPSWMLRRKSVVESTRHAVGTGQGEMLQMRASPGPNWILPLPSKDAQACPLLLNGTCTRRVTYSGSIKGLNDNECGQIGVKRIPGTFIYQQNISLEWNGNMDNLCEEVTERNNNSPFLNQDCPEGPCSLNEHPGI